jgi:ABC-type molybdate transport system substrate-binding protein
LRKDVRLSIANPESTAIGSTTKMMLETSGDWEDISKHAQVVKPTVNGICNDLKIGAVDAGIVWKSVVAMYPELEVVTVPGWEQYKRTVEMGVLRSSKDPTEALKFMRYFSARDKGLEIFRSLGYKTVDGDKWAEKPQLLFYSGGVNRVAVENTIRAFEKREGVEVTRVYNGCGILVAQIKAGQKPDAYLTCDVSFMNQVKSSFQDIDTISATRIVIATTKGNKKHIRNLEDLAEPGLKVGVCNPKQSALGTLTKRMLEQMDLWDGIFKNVVSQTPTADLLVNQLRAGGLDAVIVYAANTAQVADKIDVIPIQQKQAIAVQDMGININSDHKYLARRLFAALTSEESMANYVENGFTWEYKK